MKPIKLFLLPLFAICLGACNVKSLDKEALENYLRDESNGLIKTTASGNILLEVIYRPTDLVWERELKKGKKAMTDSLLKDLENRYYFVAIYSTPQRLEMDPLSQLIQNKQLYNKVLQNLSFNFNKLASIKIANEEEINSKGGSFSKSYGVLPYNTVLFYFEDEQIEREEEIVLELKDPGFGLATQFFKFKLEDIIKTPSLHLMKT